MNSAISYVFDLDGTISDPAVGIGRSINYALEYFGYAPLAPPEVSKFVGPPLDQEFRLIVGPVAHEHVVALVCKYRERYADVGFSENVIYPGIPEVLRDLGAAGVSLGLCTSKFPHFAERILRLFGIREHFRFISGGDIAYRKESSLPLLSKEVLWICLPR